MPFDETRTNDVGERRERSYRQCRASRLDLGELSQAPEIEKSAPRFRSRIERHENVGAAGQRYERPLVAEHRQRLAHGARFEKVELGEGGSHAFRMAR